MEKKSKGLFDLFFQLCSLIAALIPIYFIFKTSPENLTSEVLILFGIILGVVLLVFFWLFIYQRYSEIVRAVFKNVQDLSELKKDLNANKSMNDMDVRLRVLEAMTKNKKGQFNVDFRWIILALLVILIILFLRQLG